MVAQAAPSMHYFGGECFHKSAICPVCQNPLLLLADLDCRSIRQTETAKLFLELDRLPLYYCWRCCAEKLSYQVIGDAVRIFGNQGKPQGNDFPYEKFPANFERRPIRLIPIPYETAMLLAVVQEIGDSWVSKEDLKTIQAELEGLRHSHFSKSCFNHHQIGGLLNLVQGHEYLTCPNPSCKHHEMAKKGYGVRMQELAVIQNDPYSGLPMTERLGELSNPEDFNEFTQVVYWVCEECLTIMTSNRCD